MKKVTRIALFILLLSIPLVKAFSGNNDTTAKNNGLEFPEKGYWVIESNKAVPRHAIVYFYTEDGTLAYKETIEGIKLKLNGKLKRRLNQVLLNVIGQYEQEHLSLEHEKQLLLSNLCRKD